MAIDLIFFALFFAWGCICGYKWRAMNEHKITGFRQRRRIALRRASQRMMK